MKKSCICVLVLICFGGCSSGEKPEPVEKQESQTAQDLDREQLKSKLKGAFAKAKEIAQAELDTLNQPQSEESSGNMLMDGWLSIVGIEQSQDDESLAEPVWWRAAVFGFGRLLRVW